MEHSKYPICYWEGIYGISFLGKVGAAEEVLKQDIHIEG